MAPILGYWKMRGLAQAIRILLHYKEVEFVDQTYGQGPPPDFSRQGWYDVKFTLGLDWPNLPYYIDGDVKITETSAILAYLGRKYNLGSTEEARIRNDITYSVQEIHRIEYYTIAYHSNCDELKKPFLAGIHERLDKFTAWLGAHDYFGGSELVYSDFCVYELLDTWKHFAPGCLDKYDKLKAYISRMEAIPTIRKFIDSPAGMRHGPFNSKNAVWGSDWGEE